MPRTPADFLQATRPASESSGGAVAAGNGARRLGAGDGRVHPSGRTSSPRTLLPRPRDLSGDLRICSGRQSEFGGARARRRGEGGARAREGGGACARRRDDLPLGFFVGGSSSESVMTSRTQLSAASFGFVNSRSRIWRPCFFRSLIRACTKSAGMRACLLTSMVASNESRQWAF